MKYITPIRCLLLLATATIPLVAQPTNALPAQPLAADDLVALSVPNAPELTHAFRVSPDGHLRLPLLSTPIDVRRRYPQEIEQVIAAALKNERLLVNPSVSLSVVEYGSRPVTVIGAVRRPLTFQATAQSTLLDALAKAEGVSPEAGGTLLLNRAPSATGEQESLSVPLKMLLEDPSPIVNVKLYGGELIRIPDAPRVYVLGNVKRSCAIPFKDHRETTVLRVLTQAEGFAPFTAKQAVVYRRSLDRNQNGIVVDLNGILKGKKPDVQLEPYDIVYVPEAKGRKLAVNLLDRIAGFGSSVISGYLIFR